MPDPLLTDDDVAVFLLIHGAILGGYDALVDGVSGLAPDDPSRAAGFRQWFAFMGGAMHHHHHAEDEALSPLLCRLDPAFTEEARGLAAEHAALEPLVEACAQRLDALCQGQAPFEERRAAAVAELVALRDRTRLHLAREEAGMIPTMRARMRSSDMRRLERETMKHTSLEDFSLALPWLLASGTERERALLWAFIPWPVKLLYRFSWKARYERLRSPFDRQER